MLGAFFVGLVLLSVVAAAFTGRMEAVSLGVVESARKAVELALGLVGAMALFLGLVRIAEDGGLLRVVARALAPLMKRLFPEVPPEHPAMSAMILNIASNFLGLGNAATPFGIRAMQELERLNPVPGTATNAMVVFLAINTAGLALLPTTVIALRASAGSKDPAGILVATWIASGCAVVGGVVAAVLLSKLPLFRVRPDASAARTTSPTAEVALPPHPPLRTWRAVAVAACAIAVTAGLVRHVVRESAMRGGTEIARDVVSFWMIPLLLAAFVAFGWTHGVNVFESFVEGAKEGFQVALRIIPYLVGILVAIGMFRASGGLDVFVRLVAPVTVPLGVPPEVVPLAVLRPLSGSGSLCVMSEILTAHGPDSFLGYLAGTMQGSTDTTFYVLAVYFGAVGIKRTRHAVPAGLIADICGLGTAVLVANLLWRTG
ncbi:MAG TPA: nucleoside recognition domain-containing protein [Candidatus Polarisedimenticolaceae bacterium]|nr:nucleoside recognition domain-containing protein [Candidatus Polarisedimenticolaceae bacterium]